MVSLEDWENGLELMVSGPLTDDVFMDFNTAYWARMDSEEEISALLNRIQLDYYNDKIEKSSLKHITWVRILPQDSSSVKAK